MNRISPTEKIKRAVEEAKKGLAAIQDPQARSQACQDARNAINEANSELAKIYRDAVMEMYSEGRTYADIASTLNISQHRFYLMLSRARKEHGATAEDKDSISA